MINLFVAAQAVDLPTEPDRNGFTTPDPLYTDDNPDYVRAEPIGAELHTRALAAMHQAKTRYPGVAGEILAEQIAAFKELGWRGASDSPTQRLITELTQ